MVSMRMLLIALYVLWPVSEILLAVYRRAEKASGADRRSLRLLWVAIGASTLVAGLMPFTGLGRLPQPTAWVGAVLIVAGLALRWVAILSLGRYFTVDVSVAADQRVVRSGLYRYVRHPSYTGSLLSFVGLGASMQNWVSIVIVAAAVTAAFAYRIRVEEQALMQTLGKPYADYCLETKRLIPFLV